MIDLGFEPRPHQRDAHARRRRFSVIVWHRRAGKTVWAVMELLLAALRSPNKAARYGYVAPFYRQGKAVAWDYLRAYAGRVPGSTIHEAELAIELPGGSRIRIFGADNPDSLRGLYFDGVVLDEVADMRPQVWGEIIRPALTDRNGWAVFIGTPKGHNLFSETYYRAVTDPEWYADLRRADSTGAISADELERARREMTPSQFAQEFDCDFAAAVENALVPLDIVLAAQQRDTTERELQGWPKILGVDVARYGGDRSVAFMRRGACAFRPSVWRNTDLMELSGQVARVIDEKKPDAVFIDQGGVGAGVVDRLRQLGFRVTGIDFGGKPLDARFQNRRAEMWWTMAEWVKTACLPSGGELVTDLTAPTYTYANAAGKLQLESKDDMRARGLPSPDLADALALTFAAPVPSMQHPLAIASAAGQHAATEYDPYAS